MICIQWLTKLPTSWESTLKTCRKESPGLVLKLEMRSCVFSTGALAKAIYDRMFKWMVYRINKTLDARLCQL